MTFTFWLLAGLLGCTSDSAKDDDLDGDSVPVADDCDDGDPAVSPAADEIPYDGIDNDCDEATPDDDLDGDGYGLAEDCDDDDASVFPDASDVTQDGVDQNCDGVDGTDADGDGRASEATGGTDCDDEDPTTFPGAEEICGDGVVNDCDGSSGGSYAACAGVRGLGDADGKLVGEAAGDEAGYAVAGAGDVDGDGLGDLLVGAWGEDSGGSEAGAAYLVLGAVSGTLDLSAADAKLVGGAASDLAGWSVAGAGDVDGDGLGDLLVGATGEDGGGSDAGAAYLFLGRVSGTLDPSAADAKLVGEAAGDEAGYAVAGAGDVDGDGLGDLLVGATGEDSGGGGAGAAYLVLGGVSGTLDLSAADAKLVGESLWGGYAGHAGYAVAGAGDVDGDGLGDLLVGGCGDPMDDWILGCVSWDAHLVLGGVSGTRDLSDADARFGNAELSDAVYLGNSVAGAGDVDGDGLGDVLIGSVVENRYLPGTGTAYLYLGGVLGTRDQYEADATLVDWSSDDYAGYSVAGAGDVDGDGLGDLLVGSREAAYVVLGGVSGTLDLSLADATLVGEAWLSPAGYSVAGAGDVDGDGLGDLLVGAHGEDSGGSDAGAAFLVLGGGY